MKTILLKVEVPDDLSKYKVIIDAKDRNWIGTVKHEEIQLPSDEEINEAADYYSEISNVFIDVAFEEGATWLLNKLKS